VTRDYRSPGAHCTRDGETEVGGRCESMQGDVVAVLPLQALGQPATDQPNGAPCSQWRTTAPSRRLEKFAVLMACACHGQDRQRRKDDGPVEMGREERMGGSEHKRAGKEPVPRDSLDSIRLAKVVRAGTERRVEVTGKAGAHQGYPDRDDGDQCPSNCGVAPRPKPAAPSNR